MKSQNKDIELLCKKLRRIRRRNNIARAISVGKMLVRNGGSK